MSTHSGKYKFYCDNCDYKNNFKRNIAIHMLIHTGDGAFACNICDCKLKLKYHLANMILAY